MFLLALVNIRSRSIMGRNWELDDDGGVKALSTDRHF
jgi:hypothetical protein